MEQRNSNTTIISNSLKNVQSSRAAFLSNWIMATNVEFSSVDISYSVKDVLSIDNDLVRLLVYEWVWIEYVDSLNESDVMGFGTDHILTLQMSNNNYIVLDDSYIEITGYSGGNSKDIAILSAAMNDGSAAYSSPTPSSMGTQTETLVLASYSPTAAINYANAYAGHTSSGTSTSTQHPSGYNPNCYYYTADCANFVSQCLRAGGFSQSSTGSPNGWWGHTHNLGSCQLDSGYVHSGTKWMRVVELKNYLKSMGYHEHRITSATQAKPGNIIYYNTSGSDQHVVIIVDVTSSGNVLINGHTHDAYRFIYNNVLNSKACYTVCLQPNYRFSTTLYKHTKICNSCNWTASAENHSWVQYSSYYKCSVCGLKVNSIPEVRGD